MPFMKNVRILIFGGTGSLGHALVKAYIDTNIIINYSRSEHKQWEMSATFQNHKNLSHIIGDISDLDRVAHAIRKANPEFIIIASALKHVDKGETNVNEFLKTNYGGTLNVLNVLEQMGQQNNVIKDVCFVSSDKACSPINAYGFTKALAEKLIIEKASYLKNIKTFVVRYGNVLNSNGSIIPALHEIGKNPHKLYFTLTHMDMTRFLMTLSQAVELIEHAYIHARSGEIVIPKLISMSVKDLLDIFSEHYKKPVKVTGIRPGEKLLETLINITQSKSMRKVETCFHILPFFALPDDIDQTIPNVEYDSTLSPLSKLELEKLLHDLALL